ncbi:MAG: nonstructural protein [Microvirus sp.]|nr:MAG: nonstructural protein [Microvirus sp.]
MTTGIYAIKDTLADTIIGGLHLFKHDAAAIRFFGDVASEKNTIVNKHVSDHELVHLGSLDETSGSLVADHRVIMTGAAWLAASTPNPDA